ncbi:MAG: flippase-like domain-containing protein [Candidatus Shapirobacteria bacterium]|nr:flippase-like domain-containing protein [Candidatus Shapirobacteria bacterium]
MLKRVFGSKILKFCFSLVLIYFAFRKIDIVSLFRQLMGMKAWFLLLNILVSFFLVALISYRWALLLIKKPTLKDVMVFAKSSFAASFYGLFFPTAAAGDILKWIIIDEKYPEVPKTKLLGSVILDRLIGLTMFVFTGTSMLVLARLNGMIMPWLIELIFGGLAVGCILFYVALVFFDLTKIWQIKWLNKFQPVSELFCRNNAGQIFRGAAVSLLSEVFWIFQMWFISWYFGADLSVISIFIYLPIISMILILPISFAGFGAREQLYLFFFVAVASSPESVLLTSTFSGVLGVFISLLGGLVTLTPDFKESVKNSDFLKKKQNS